MFILIRALVYATLFIGFLLIAVPARLLSASGLTSPSLAGPVQLLGAAMAVAGALVAVACILTFVVIGRGTPAPFDPPRKLVARGPYRFVRNPMYLGAAMAMSGAAIVYRSWLLIGYVAVFLAITHAFVVGYEEPTLRRTFGAAYDDYCRRVGRWWPAFSFVLALALVIAAVLSAQWPVLASGLVANSIRTAKWGKDLRAGVPTAKIVELPGASLYMFLSNEADIIRELREFGATLPR